MILKLLIIFCTCQLEKSHLSHVFRNNWWHIDQLLQPCLDCAAFFRMMRGRYTLFEQNNAKNLLLISYSAVPKKRGGPNSRGMGKILKI